MLSGRYGKPVSRRTVECHGVILRNALNYVVNIEGLLAVNQASKVSLIRPDTNTPTPWFLSELNILLTVVSKHRLYFYYRLMACTGARRGELLAIKWADFDGRRIAITKSGRTTTKTKGGDGKPFGGWVVTQLFIKSYKCAGLRHIRLHDLRHLHATELLSLGEPLHVLFKRLGQADPIVTATIYAHVSDEQADTASTTFANGAHLAN